MLKKIIIQKMFFSCFVYCFAVEKTIAQRNSSGDNCEIMASKLDTAFFIYSTTKLENSYLIIVVGVSKNENSTYNQRRILQTIKYLQMRGIKDKEIIYGTGKKSDDLGYVRFYVNGIKVVDISPNIKSGICYEVDNPDKIKKLK